MRTIIYIIIVILGVSVGWLAWDIITSKPVSEREFKRAHIYLNKRVDTLSRNQRIMIKNQKILYHNQKTILDSIKAIRRQLTQLSEKLDQLTKQVHNLEVGQYVIYDAITGPQPQAESKTTFLNLRRWFKKQK